MYSGDSATPTIVRRRSRPLMTAGTLIAGLQPVRVDEPLAGQHLVGAARLDPAAAAQKQIVDARPPVGRDRDQPAGRRLVELHEIERDVRDDARLDAETPGSAAISVADAAAARASARRRRRRSGAARSTRAASPCSDAKFERYITNIATPPPRPARWPAPGPHRQRSRSSLRSSAEIAHAAHHDSSLGASFVVRSSTPTTRPSASRITRSAMSAIAALCVITAVVVPSSR